MAELESVLEKRLIEQLCSEDSQWTYRPDITTEDDLMPEIIPLTRINHIKVV